MFAVFKYGVFCQGCLGFFDTLLRARTVALIALIAEHDDYHRFVVVRFYPDCAYAKEPDPTLILWREGPKRFSGTLDEYHSNAGHSENQG